MKRFFNPGTPQLLALALMYLIAGAILLIFGGNILSAAVQIFGIILAVYGAWDLYVYFGRHHSMDTSPLLLGTPALVIGLLLAFWPHLLINFFPVLVGILLLFNSVVQMQKSLLFKSSGYPGWTAMMIGAVIMLAAGIFLLVRPASVVNIITKLCGAFLLAEAVMIFWQSMAGHKYGR